MTEKLGQIQRNWDSVTGVCTVLWILCASIEKKKQKKNGELWRIVVIITSASVHGKERTRTDADLARGLIFCLLFSEKWWKFFRVFRNLPAPPKHYGAFDNIIVVTYTFYQKVFSTQRACLIFVSGKVTRDGFAKVSTHCPAGMNRIFLNRVLFVTLK